jgi:hypothetical protein
MKLYSWQNETKFYSFFLFRETSEISWNNFFVSSGFVFCETKKETKLEILISTLLRLLKILKFYDFAAHNSASRRLYFVPGICSFVQCQKPFVQRDILFHFLRLTSDEHTFFYRFSVVVTCFIISNNHYKQPPSVVDL